VHWRSITICKGVDLNKEIIRQLVYSEHPVLAEIGSSDGLDTQEFISIFSDTDFSMYCFEPDVRNIKTFKQTIHDSRVTLFEGVVGDKTGIVDFYQSTKSPATGEELIYSSSMREPNAPLYQTWPQFINGFVKTKVNSIRLDNFVDNNNIPILDFVWLDCQGCEDMIINGGESTFKNKVKYLYTEYSDREIYKGEPTLTNIMNLLPTYSIVGIWTDSRSNFQDGDVLLINRNIK
jgi:FkbM family methyltransferase